MDNLITLEQFLEFMPTLIGADPLVLNSYISVASETVRSYCNRNFTYGSFSERIFYGPLLMDKVYSGLPINVYVKNYPVDVITNIEVVSFISGSCGSQNQFNNLGNFEGVTNTQEQLISWNVPYVVQKTNGFIQLLPRVNPCPWWYSLAPSQFIVNYTGGFQTIPAPVQMATAMLAKQQLEYNSQSMLMLSERIGDYSYTRGPVSGSLSGLSIPQGSLVQQLLGPFQRRGANGL